MIPLFCYNISKKMKMQGTEFLVKKAPKSAINRIDKIYDEENEYKNKNVSLPFVLNIIETILLFPAGMSASLIVGLFIEKSISFSQFIEDWTFWFYIGIISWLLLSIIFSVRIIRERNYKKSERYALYMDRLDRLYESLYMEMDVPAGTPDTSIIYFSYRIKNGKIKPEMCGKYDQLYKIWELKVYSDEKKLYLASDEEVYAIDMSGIKRIRKNESSARVFIEKSQKETIAKFKKHNVKQSVLEGYKIETYILEFEYKGELWVIYFPHYELPVFEQITGIKTE